MVGETQNGGGKRSQRCRAALIKMNTHFILSEKMLHLVATQNFHYENLIILHKRYKIMKSTYQNFYYFLISLTSYSFAQVLYFRRLSRFVFINLISFIVTNFRSIHSIRSRGSRYFVLSHKIFHHAMPAAQII